MSLSTTQLEALQAPLNKSAVKSRSQSGQSLTYVEGHHCIREANRIFGFDGWERSTQDIQLVQAEKRENANKKLLWYVGYVAKSVIKVGEVVRHGVGFGQGIDTDLGRAHESAIKEAETDAMKRALMTFGDQFGLALYDKEQANVTDDTKKPPVATPAVIAGNFIKEIGATSAQFQVFRTTCNGRGKDWITVALCAKEDAVTDFDSLLALVQKEAA